MNNIVRRSFMWSLASFMFILFATKPLSKTLNFECWRYFFFNRWLTFWLGFCLSLRHRSRHKLWLRFWLDLCLAFHALLKFFHFPRILRNFVLHWLGKCTFARCQCNFLIWHWELLFLFILLLFRLNHPHFWLLITREPLHLFQNLHLLFFRFRL